jgi:tetratricopeptide (TPR) repeat protein
MGDKYGYDTKIYNLLGVALMVKGDYDRALKIFESALEALSLDTPELADGIYKGNEDLASLIGNYFKCQAILNASWELVTSDEKNKSLMAILIQISSNGDGLI